MGEGGGQEEEGQGRGERQSTAAGCATTQLSGRLLEGGRDERRERNKQAKLPTLTNVTVRSRFGSIRTRMKNSSKGQFTLNAVV